MASSEVVHLWHRKKRKPSHAGRLEVLARTMNENNAVSHKSESDAVQHKVDILAYDSATEGAN